VESVSGNRPGFFGIVIPLLETRLGIALILGALSLPVALLSLLALTTIGALINSSSSIPLWGCSLRWSCQWPAWAAFFCDLALEAG
jgi:thiosulfate dehydrogenase [quinone] large subunit